MLNFQEINIRDYLKLRGYYQNCTYHLCEYSLGIKTMWRHYLNPAYAEAGGCLIVRNFIHGEYFFDFPVPGPNGNIEVALSEIESDCFQRGIELNFSVVPEEQAPAIMTRYPHLEMDNITAWQDYLYTPESMVSFSGRRYAGHRNHIKQFYRAHPDAFFRVLTKEDAPLLQRFWSEFEATLEKMDASAQRELQYAKELFDYLENPCFCTGAIEESGRLLAISLGEICGDTLIIHIEKAMHNCNGIYPAIVQAFAEKYQTPKLQFINREDDASEPGLRYSKYQYAPAARGEKYRFRVRRRIPSLKNNLEVCENNVVCRVQNENNGSKLRADDSIHFSSDTMRFSVIQNNVPCGEVLLFDFDYHGGAWLRFIPEDGVCDSSCEKTALSLISDWALYKQELSVVCFSFSEYSEHVHDLPDHTILSSSEDGQPLFYVKRM